MRIVQVQINSWDKCGTYLPNNLDLAIGDQVIVKNELGMDIGKVIGFLNIDEEEYLHLQNKSREQLLGEDNLGDDNATAEANSEDQTLANQVLRPVTPLDIERLPSAEEKKRALEYCVRIKDKLGLPMKFIDAHYMFDGSRLIFAFIAEGRVDFRELVKDLTRHFGKTIRLQQIGIRDEAKIMGDFGHCGRELCCKGFLNELASITSEMSELQQCSHRGSERISGICGRLMCCLAYEQLGYEEIFKKIPAIGTKVNIDGKRGEVVGQHILKQSVDVKFSGENNEEEMIIEVDLKKRGKKT